MSLLLKIKQLMNIVELKTLLLNVNSNKYSVTQPVFKIIACGNCVTTKPSYEFGCPLFSLSKPPSSIDFCGV